MNQAKWKQFILNEESTMGSGAVEGLPLKLKPQIVGQDGKVVQEDDAYSDHDMTPVTQEGEYDDFNDLADVDDDSIDDSFSESDEFEDESDDEYSGESVQKGLPGDDWSLDDSSEMDDETDWQAYEDDSSGSLDGNDEAQENWANFDRSESADDDLFSESTKGMYKDWNKPRENSIRGTWIAEGSQKRLNEQQSVQQPIPANSQTDFQGIDKRVSANAATAMKNIMEIAWRDQNIRTMLSTPRLKQYSAAWYQLFNQDNRNSIFVKVYDGISATDSAVNGIHEGKNSVKKK